MLLASPHYELTRTRRTNSLVEKYSIIQQNTLSEALSEYYAHLKHITDETDPEDQLIKTSQLPDLLQFLVWTADDPLGLILMSFFLG